MKTCYYSDWKLLLSTTWKPVVLHECERTGLLGRTDTN